MTESPLQTLSVEFIGCSQHVWEIVFLVNRIRDEQCDPSSLWQSIRAGEIDRQTMPDAFSQTSGGQQAEVLPTVHFIFAIQNISRDCYLNFLNTHINPKLAGSIRKTDISNRKQQFITPPAFLENSDVSKRWETLTKEIAGFIELCDKQGISPQKAGVSLPLVAISRDIFAIEFKSLQQFLDHNLCEMAPWEPKSLAWQLYEAMQSEFPMLARRLGVKCWETRQMYCNESVLDYHSCRFGNGCRPHKNNLEALWYANRTLPEPDTACSV